MSPSYLTVQSGKTYRVIGRPEDKTPEQWPVMGMEGVCQWTSSYDKACLKIAGDEVVMPINCIEEVIESMDDALLITAMLSNPEGTIKLLRGLWRMTKHDSIRNLMERGQLPEYDANKIKTKQDYDKDWDEWRRASCGFAE